jgi:Mitochondrial carrier protein
MAVEFDKICNCTSSRDDRCFSFRLLPHLHNIVSNNGPVKVARFIKLFDFRDSILAMSTTSSSSSTMNDKSQFIPVISGLVAGASGVVIGHPLDTVKVKLQVSGTVANLSWSLYRGLLPPLLVSYNIVLNQSVSQPLIPLPPN